VASSVLKYLEYLISAKSAYGIHSPFVYRFIHELLENKNDDYYSFQELDKVRERLLKNKKVVEITDFGAGSKVFKDNKRKIRDIAKHGISKSKFSELYFKLVNFFDAEYIVELGTSLGLNSLYLAKANSKAKVYTIEGDVALAAFAEELIKNEKAENVKILNGKFENTLPSVLNDIPRLDLFYVDGNHQYEPTLQYFEMGLRKKHNNSVFVFDDINWNDEMRKAWEEIKSHPEVTLSIDMFFVGLVFFRKEHKQKEHFVLRY
jgi:predicted O-methyltransferase YrrM